MKPIHNGIIPAVLFIGICTYLHCSKTSNDNPVDPVYVGHYSLKVNTVYASDSVLEVFGRYALACSTGVDTFAGYQFPKPADSPAVVTIDSVVTPRTKGFDTVVFTCIRPYSGNVSIEGMRPNGAAVAAYVPVHIVNPYVIAGDSQTVAGRPDSLRVDYSGRQGMSASSLRVKWSMAPHLLDTTLPIQTPLRFTSVADDSVNQIVKASLLDEAGRVCTLASFPVKINKTIRPALDSNKVALQAVLEAPLTLIIDHTGREMSPYTAYVSLDDWQDSADVTSLKAVDTIKFTRPVEDTGLKSFTVYVVNGAGQSDKIKKGVFITYTLPVVYFDKETLVASLSKKSVIALNSAPAAFRYVWNIDTLPSQSTDSSNIYVLLSDTNLHTLHVYGINKFGFRGKTASIPVHARNFTFDIKLQFPPEIKARSWLSWIAGVDDENKAQKRNVRFQWTVTPQKYDSMKVSGVRKDTLKLFCRDTATVRIGITASDDSAGTFAPFEMSAAVKRYAPRCMFKDRTVTMKTTDSVWCAVSVADSNTGGRVDSIFWSRGGKNPSAVGNCDTTISVKSTVPDTFWISAYAQDNDGFPSKKDSIRFFVQAYQPYILPQLRDTVVFLNTAFAFFASGHVSDSSAAIAMYYWDFDGDGSWDDSSSSSTMTHAFASVGTFSVIVKCRDGKKSESIPDTFKVTVTKGEPSVDGISPDRVWFGENAAYMISANTLKPGDSIAGYYVSWNNSDSFGTYATKSFNYAYADSGRHIVKLYVRSKDGLVSETRIDTIYIDPDKPVIDSLRLEAAAGAVFVNDPCSLRVFGRFSNDTIDSFAVSWGDGSAKVVQKGKVFLHTYPIGVGTYTITAAARNSHGFWSEPATKQVPVRLGKPVVTAFSPESVWVNDDTAFTCAAYDTNGTVDSILINWGDGTSPTWFKTGNLIDHSYDKTQSGMRTAKVVCKDDDGIYSDTVSFSINVKIGKPLFTQIKTDSALSRIFVRDTVKYTVKGIDPNGSIDSILVSWNNNSQFEWVTVVNKTDSACFMHAFARNESGPRNVLFRLVGDDGLTTDSIISINVLSGAPRVNDVTVDTGRGNVFINDKRKYNVQVFDTNGTIRKIFASWHGDSTVSDTSFDVSFKSGSGDFYHIFADSGLKRLWFWTMDEDSILSPKRKDSVFVRLAPPVLWGDRGDTLWVPVNDNYDKSYPIHINSFDTNGVNQKPIRFYWQASGQPFDTLQNEVAGVFRKSNQDTVFWLFLNQSTPDQSKQLWVAGLDDDKLLRGRTSVTPWIVFADSAPPKPGMISEQYPDSVLIRWDNYDAKDGPDSTIFEVLIGPYNGTPVTTKVIQAGALFPKASNHYTYKIGLVSESFSYRVVAQDKRGTRSLGDIRNYTP